MSAANSRIRDVDYADETAKQARNQILTAAGTSVLAQANMSSQSALKLIG
jgi:flagellin